MYLIQGSITLGNKKINWNQIPISIPSLSPKLQ